MFTEDGTFIDLLGVAVIGRDRLMGHVKAFSSDVSDSERIGDLTATETGTFTFRNQFRAGDQPFDCVTEIELDGHLASRIAFLECLDT